MRWGGGTRRVPLLLFLIFSPRVHRVFFFVFFFILGVHIYVYSAVLRLARSAKVARGTGATRGGWSASGGATSPGHAIPALGLGTWTPKSEL